MNDSLIVALNANSQVLLYTVSVVWSLAWIFIGFVCAVVFWYNIVRQFIDK